ncbi:MAG TPA: hypothetical protein VFR67_18365 [Pilimelia sp.]|nr:hypothetical protein [Pilimelia sp.]
MRPRPQDRFGELLARPAGTYPETYAGGGLAEWPGAASVIRFKGQVPSGAAAWTRTRSSP